MKKLKLLVAACALFGMSSTMWAQTDVTASYIGNVDRIIQGAGHNCGNNHKLANAGGSQGEGYFNTQTLGGWHNFVANTANVAHGVESWTGNAGSEGWILGRAMVLPQGKYTLKFTAMTNNIENTVLKCGDEEKNFNAQDTYEEYSFDIDVTTANTAYEFGIYQKNGGKANWSVMGNISLTLTSTTVAPVDNSSISAFTYSGTQTWHTNTWSLEGNTDGSKFLTPFHELWVASGNKLADATIKASYTPAETGVYKVSAWVRAMNESGGAVTGAKIFVGDVSADACTGSVVYSGKGRLGTYTAMADGVSGTPFEYGFILENAEINWLAFKNVTITYLGDLPQDEIDALLAQVPTGPMNANVKSELDGHVSNLNTTKSVANFNSLSLYLPTAKASADIYATINALMETYAAKAAVLDAAGQAAYDASAIQTKYDNGTYETADGVEAELAAAYATAVKAQTTAGSDWTGVIVNPSFESDFSNGWTNSGMARQGNTSFGKDGSYYAECWQPDGTKSLKQTLTAMPAGVYTLSARVKARGVTSAKIFAAGIEQAVTIEDNENDYSVTFACDANADVEIGFEGVGTKVDASWLCIDNFTLTLVSAGLPDVTAIEGKMNAEAAAAQTAAVEAYSAERTVANYNAASAAITAAQTSKDAYTAAAAALAKADALLESTNLYTADAYAEFYDIVSTAQTGYEEGTLTTEEAAALNGKIFGTGWRSTAAVDDFLISAWDVEARDWNTYHVNTWSTKADSNNPNFETPCIEYWTGDNATLADKVLTATLSDFTPGDTYKVTATVCAGVNTGVDATTAPEGITLQLNDGDAVSVCTGSRVAETRFYEGEFEASGMIGVDGKLNIKFNVAGTNVSWMTFRNVKYEKTADAVEASAEELAALDAAIAAAEAHTLGFEASEYAPYNNVEAVEVLAVAKDTKANATAQVFVLAATKNLTEATWVKNETELDAVYDGDLQNAPIQATSDNVVLSGWTTKSGNTRQTFKGNGEEDGKACLGEDGVGLFVHPGTYNYGETTGYTMPLKAGKGYVAEAKYCSWQNESNNNFTLSILKNGETVATKSYGANKTAATEADALKTVKLYFKPAVDGNYVLSVGVGGNTFMTGFHITTAEAEDIVIAEDADYTPANKFANVTFQRTLVEGWNGLVLPYDATVSEVKTTFSATEVKDFTSVSYEEGKGATLNFEDATEVKAGRPFMIKAAAGTSYTIEGVVLSENALQQVTMRADDDAAVYTFKGTYAAKTDLTTTEFVLFQGDKYFYHTKDGGKASSAKAFRAYLVNETPEPADEDASRVSFNFGDGETTGIAEAGKLKKDGDAALYDLLGRRVAEKSLTKGIYVVNGKKVVVK